MVLKWIGAAMVTGASGTLGFYWGGRLTSRLDQMRTVRQILHMLKGEINYSVSTLAESFAVIAGKVPPPFQEFLEQAAERMEALDGRTLEQIWRQEISRIRKKTSLSAEDIREWENLGGRLGYLDRAMQLQLIDLFLLQWEEKIRVLEQECGKTCRLYRYLGILAGLLITVTLI